MKIGCKRLYGLSVIEHFSLIPCEKRIYKRIVKAKLKELLRDEILLLDEKHIPYLSIGISNNKFEEYLPEINEARMEYIKYYNKISYESKTTQED